MIALACDHAAVGMKNEIIKLLDDMGLEYKDFGTYTEESCAYPVFAARAARAVAAGECDRGIVICGTGIGISIAANKVRGIRCGLCSDPLSAELTRRHNDANMLAFGARIVGVELAKAIVRTFLTTPYEGGRHQARVDMLAKLENGEEIE
ncbi:MAG: ribose 5-phosphate isomerase B [Ruminococcaceae bacterium]|nr:ribose 5-phosphate isomerase B [Oscillospiraceae bacterium]